MFGAYNATLVFRKSRAAKTYALDLSLRECFVLKLSKAKKRVTI